MHCARRRRQVSPSQVHSVVSAITCVRSATGWASWAVKVVPLLRASAAPANETAKRAAIENGLEIRTWGGSWELR